MAFLQVLLCAGVQVKFHPKARSTFVKVFDAAADLLGPCSRDLRIHGPVGGWGPIEAANECAGQRRSVGLRSS